MRTHQKPTRRKHIPEALREKRETKLPGFCFSAIVAHMRLQCWSSSPQPGWEKTRVFRCCVVL